MHDSQQVYNQTKKHSISTILTRFTPKYKNYPCDYLNYL